MSASRRLGQPVVAFPPEPIFLDFPRSDGDASKWPPNITRIVDADGQVNYMEALDVDESAQARKWRASVGKAVATKLEMQGDRKCVSGSTLSYTSHRSQQTNMFCVIGLQTIGCSTTTKDLQTIHDMISIFSVSITRHPYSVIFIAPLQDARGLEDIALSTNSYPTLSGFSPTLP